MSKLEAAIDAALASLIDAIEHRQHEAAALYAEIVQKLHSIGGIKF